MRKEDGEPPNPATPDPRFSWNRSRVALSLFLYSFVTMAGAAIIARAGGGARVGGWIIFGMLAWVGVCMWTERGQWAIWKRLTFPFFAWALQAVLTVPAMPLGAAMVVLGQPSNYVDRIVEFCASLPIVLFAMRQSRWFVHASWRCAACGNEDATDAQFCAACGAKRTLSSREQNGAG